MSVNSHRQKTTSDSSDGEFNNFLLEGSELEDQINNLLYEKQQNDIINSELNTAYIEVVEDYSIDESEKFQLDASILFEDFTQLINHATPPGRNRPSSNYIDPFTLSLNNRRTSASKEHDRAAQFRKDTEIYRHYRRLIVKRRMLYVKLAGKLIAQQVYVGGKWAIKWYINVYIGPLLVGGILKTLLQHVGSVVETVATVSEPAAQSDVKSPSAPIEIAQSLVESAFFASLKAIGFYSPAQISNMRIKYNSAKKVIGGFTGAEKSGFKNVVNTINAGVIERSMEDSDVVDVVDYAKKFRETHRIQKNTQGIGSGGLTAMKQQALGMVTNANLLIKFVKKLGVPFPSIPISTDPVSNYLFSVGEFGEASATPPTDVKLKEFFSNHPEFSSYMETPFYRVTKLTAAEDGGGSLNNANVKEIVGNFSVLSSGYVATGKQVTLASQFLEDWVKVVKDGVDGGPGGSPKTLQQFIKDDITQDLKDFGIEVVVKPLNKIQDLYFNRIPGVGAINKFVKSKVGDDFDMNASMHMTGFDLGTLGREVIQGLADLVNNKNVSPKDIEKFKKILTDKEVLDALKKDVDQRALYYKNGSSYEKIEELLLNDASEGPVKTVSKYKSTMFKGLEEIWNGVIDTTAAVNTINTLNYAFPITMGIGIFGTAGYIALQETSMWIASKAVDNELLKHFSLLQGSIMTFIKNKKFFDGMGATLLGAVIVLVCVIWLALILLYAAASKSLGGLRQLKNLWFIVPKILFAAGKGLTKGLREALNLPRLILGWVESISKWGEQQLNVNRLKKEIASLKKQSAEEPRNPEIKDDLKQAEANLRKAKTALMETETKAVKKPTTTDPVSSDTISWSSPLGWLLHGGKTGLGGVATILRFFIGGLLAPNDGQKLFGKSKIEWRAFATKWVYYFRDQIGFIIKDLNSMLKSTIIENLVENRILKIVTESMLSLTELVADVMLNNEAHAAIRATTKFIASTTEDEIINLISFKRLNSIMISLAKNPSLLDLIFSRSTTVNQIGIEAHTLFKGTSRTIGGEFGASVVVRGEEDEAIFGADKWGILGFMETLYLNKGVGHRIPGYSIYNSIRSFYYSNEPPRPSTSKEPSTFRILWRWKMSIG